MPVSSDFKKVSMPTGRPKRRVPHDPAHQLLSGRASDGAAATAWNQLMHPEAELEHQYGPNRFNLLISLYLIVQKLEKIARMRHNGVALCTVSVDSKVNRYLDIKPIGILILELTESSARNRAFEIVDRFPGCDLHPYFLQLIEILKFDNTAEINKSKSNIEEISNILLHQKAHDRLRNDSQIYNKSDEINKFLVKFTLLFSDLKEIKKSFIRTAQENRRRLMQYAYHLVSETSQTSIIHLTIRPSIEISNNTPMTRTASESLRNRMTIHLKREITDRSYLGQAMLLKRDVEIGHWIDVFVFYTKNVLIQDTDLVRQIIDRWNGTENMSSAGCAGEILYQTTAARDIRYIKILERIALVTEPDFYCRVSSEGLHRFWCTGSPIGKLSERTKQRKRYKSEAKRDAKSADTPIGHLEALALANAELLDDARWQQKRDSHRAKKAVSRKKSDQTRSRNNKAQAPKAATTQRYIKFAAANDESVESQQPILGNTSATGIKYSLTDRQQADRIVDSPSAAPTNEVQNRPFPPIELQRRPKPSKENNEGRVRVTVEVRKKRRPPPEQKE